MNCLEALIKSRKLADTHAHLDYPEYSRNFSGLLKHTQDHGVQEIWLMSTDYAAILKNIELVSKWQKLFPKVKIRLGVGFDMEMVVPGSDLFDMSWFSQTSAQLEVRLTKLYAGVEAAAKDNSVEIDLIGEIGIDHYWLQQNYQLSINDPEAAADQGVTISAQDVAHSQALQKAMFKFQLNYAAEHNLPVNIHSRGAESECIRIVRQLQAEKPHLTGIFHSFTGNAAEMRQIINTGFYVGVNGIVTYKSAMRLAQIVRRHMGLLSAQEVGEEAGRVGSRVDQPLLEPDERKISLQRLTIADKLQLLYSSGFVLETDSPYLRPGNLGAAKSPEHLEKVNLPASILNVLDYLFTV